MLQKMRVSMALELSKYHIAILLGEYSYPISSYLIPQFAEFTPSEKEKFYHYTSIDACNKLLDRKENDFYELWASHLSFLNDKEEYKNGLELIKKQFDFHIENSAKEFPIDIVNDFKEGLNEKLFDVSLLARDVYIICFSMNSDSLTQWKYYGKNCGVAIEFNLRQCKYSGFLADVQEKILVKTIGLYKVIYDDEKKIKIIDKILDDTYRKYKKNKPDEASNRRLLSDLKKLYAICPLFKHKDFKDEKECRLIFRPLYEKNQKKIPELFNYRIKDGILIPYLRIKLHPINDNFIPPVVSSVTIGPGQNQDLVYKSIYHMIARKNPDIELTNVKMSSTPFRG